METKNEIQKLEPVTAKQLSNYLDAMGLATQLTEKEKTQFLEISQAFGLNPFKREIYCSKYGTQTSIIVGYETYIKRAERSGQLDGWQVVTEGKVEDNSLKAIITIHRKDRKIPFIHEVFYSEYVQMKDGRPTKFWQKAYTMTKKVAIAQGFRLCFSDELGGMPYTADEIPEQETHDVTYTTVEEIKPEPEVILPIAPTEKEVNHSISLLESCMNEKELRDMWVALGGIIQKVPEVLVAKDKRKVELTPVA